MARVAVFDALGENVVELAAQGEYHGDYRGGGGLRLVVEFLEFEEVEVVSPAFHLGGALHRLFGDGAEGESRGNGERLLAAGHHDVDSELVLFYRHCRERAHGVDYRHDVGEFFENFRNGLDVAHRSGGGLVVDYRDGVVLAGGELFFERFGVDGLAPVEFQFSGVLAAPFGNVIPLVGKRAVAAVEHALFDDVADGALHHAPRGARAEENRVFGVEELFETRHHVLHELHEVFASVAHDGGRHGLVGFFGHFDGSGNEQFV